MRPQTIAVIALALTLGGASFLGVQQFMGQGTRPTDTVSVVLAAVPIERGTMVTPELVTTKAFPKELVPLGAVLDPADVNERAARMTMAAGEVVFEAKLSPKGMRGAAVTVPKGMRAFTISTPNQAAGVAGFVMPGDKVDVLLTMNNDGANAGIIGGSQTTTLLQRIEVLGVDQLLDAPADNKAKDVRTVTVLVDPQQAQQLGLAQTRGTLVLSLRNPEDDADAKTRPVNEGDLRFAQGKPKPVWSEQAKDVMKAFGEALAKAPKPDPKPAAVPPPAEPTVAEAEEPPPMQRKAIRTIRGRIEGVQTIMKPGPRPRTRANREVAAPPVSEPSGRTESEQSSTRPGGRAG